MFIEKVFNILQYVFIFKAIALLFILRFWFNRLRFPSGHPNSDPEVEPEAFELSLICGQLDGGPLEVVLQVPQKCIRGDLNSVR